MVSRQGSTTARARSGPAYDVHRAGRVLVAALIAAGLWLAAAAPAGAAEVPSLYDGKFSTCFWNIGVITPRYINIATQDSKAYYWASVYTVPPGATLQLQGRFAHARYMAIQSYDLAGVGTDAVADYQIDPDPGSNNPYRKGVPRTVSKRSFTLSLPDSSPPAPINLAPGSDEPPTNTLYTKPAGDTSGLNVVMWRVFIPDRGRDFRGGVALPHPVLRLADGSVLTGQQACDALTSQVHRLPPDPSAFLIGEEQYNELRYQPGVPPYFPAEPTPAWRVQYNRDYLLALYTGPTYQPVIVDPPKGGQGGFFPNLHVQYARAALNRKLGTVVAFRGKMATTPLTYDRERLLEPTQLRYQSFCMVESILTTRVMGCRYDEEIPLHGKRRYTVVVSRKADRPRNARAKCGVAWIRWSARGDGGDDHDFGWLQLRNMLPSPGFHQALQNTEHPGDERAVMGDYLPRGRYYDDKHAFQKLGCPVR